MLLSILISLILLVATTTAQTTTTTTTTTTPQTYTCGVAYYQPRIVGGTNAVPYSWPWQVYLNILWDEEINIWGNCGGTLINNQWIVTAAHCIAGDSGIAILGIYNLTNPSQSTSVTFTQMFVHPSYNASIVRNDIALIKLSQPVTFSDKINSICLTSTDLATVNTNAVATGWGKTSNPGSTSNILIQVSIPVQSMSWCSFANTDSTTQICAGNTVPHQGVCNGDSGGPLNIINGGQYYLAGVTSATDAGCTGRNLFTRVSYYYSWIMTTISNN